MRDPNRIEPFLQELKEYWQKHPNLRFCQLVVNITYPLTDPFYLEDEKFLENLHAFTSRYS